MWWWDCTGVPHSLMLVHSLEYRLRLLCLWLAYSIVKQRFCITRALKVQLLILSVKNILLRYELRCYLQCEIFSSFKDGNPKKCIKLVWNENKPFERLHEHDVPIEREQEWQKTLLDLSWKTDVKLKSLYIPSTVNMMLYF